MMDYSRMEGAQDFVDEHSRGIVFDQEELDLLLWCLCYASDLFDIESALIATGIKKKLVKTFLRQKK